ncbi:MAG: hypothetical protein IPN80_12820 [Flavobacterium sp.]|nr:hypothetical protein [Flavobacterium sp.]
MIKRFCLRLKAIILRADRQILYFKDYYDSSQIFSVASIHFFFVDVVSSQSEFLNPTNTIPPKGSGFSLPKSNTPSLYTPGSTPKPMSSSTIETQKMQFALDNKFKNPGDLVGIN